MSTKKPLLSLPLAKSLPQFLVPDPIIDSPKQLFALSKYTSKNGSAKPSMLRRSRAVHGHFSYVTPLPVEFPYRVPDDMVQALKDAGETEIDIEDILKKLEPDTNTPPLHKGDTFHAYSSKDRPKAVSDAELLGISRKCLQDVLPNLDVEGESAKQLVDVLSGRAVLARLGETEQDTFAPWSLCYAGHQFGSYASQLGDGRAISIMTTDAPPAPSPANYYNPPIAELQLKGSGRTPFSRFADGLAVLRSSVREYLGSEHMAALNIPTSRALALVHLPDLEVIRESRETGAIVTRVAPSWVRIGNFEIQKERREWDNILKLARYLVEHVYGYDLAQKNKEVARTVLREVANRNAIMVAGWQVYGFMHGVMNTDNISVLGITIDYGPYAFMDVFNFGHICNHSDDMGRYAYRHQPNMIEYAIRKLGEALAETIGAEIQYDGVQEGWAKGKDHKDLRELREKGLAFVDEIISEYKDVFKKEYLRLFAKRLGFLDIQPADQQDYFDSFLELMSTYELDFSHTFRTLCHFPGTSSPHLDRFLTLLLPDERIPKYAREDARPAFKQWLESYEKRLASFEQTVSESVEDRKQRMLAANPRFVLRQWILEEAIKKLGEKNDTEFLERVLNMCVEPFKAYGEANIDEAEDGLTCPDKETAESIRLCRMGSQDMLGFQCSCSS